MIKIELMGISNEVKYPSYLNLSPTEWDKRIRMAREMLNPCRVCPRRCGVNRLKKEKGFCFLGEKPAVFSFGPDFGKEKCFVGKYGSGAINFSFCNLACVFCRSYNISQAEKGTDFSRREISAKKLAKIMLYLQKQRCHNINLVNPSSQIPQILEALFLATKNGLNIPLIYNTNAYDSVESLKLLDGIIDIYLPDFKYSDDKIAEKYSRALNYFEIAKNSIKEMHRQVGDLCLDEKGLVIKGLLVRHLILPNNLSGPGKIFQYLSKKISSHTRINIMNRYTPCWQAKRFPEIDRMIETGEYKKTIEMAKKYKLNWFTE